MFTNRAVLLGVMAAATVLWAAPGEHLDRHETRRIIRSVQEQSLTFFDRLDDWTEERWDDRFHQLDELNDRISRFNTAVNGFTSELRTHREPWELRDRARAIIDASTELGRSVNHAEFLPREVHQEWETLRNRVDELSGHFHLSPVESR